MKNTFRASMTWLHTWCGLLLAWLLYAIFITGTASYYRPEITQWMQPELRPHVAAPAVLMERALGEIRRQAPDATTIYVRFPNDRDPGLQLNWQTPDGQRHAKVVDAETARLEARDSRGGEFFYRFHFQLQLPYPWGRFIACFAAVFMLVALVTGIVAHRQFFKDFFTFRPSKPGTRSWLDVHNLTGVLALPFYFMIAYSAQVIFVEMFMPWGKWATEPPALIAEATASQTAPPAPSAAPTPPSDIPPLPIAALVESYTARYGTLPLGTLYATGLGTERGVASFRPWADQEIAYDSRNTLNLHAVTGAPLTPPPNPGLFVRIHDVFYGLHMVRFAGPALRALFFLLGVMGSLLCATGLVMWTVKRRKRQEALRTEGRTGFGHWLVERLNIAVLIGFPLALSTIFWANRLLPFDLPQRGDLEVDIVFIVWGLTLIHAMVRPVMRAWREQLWTAAALFALLPFLDVVTTPDPGARLAFNLIVLVLGGLLAWAALRVQRGRRRPHAPHPETAP